jgi:hypothetical protein
MKHVELSTSDWAEVFAALQSKRDHSAVTEGDIEWQAQLKKIITRIGPDGCDAAKRGVKSCRLDDWTVVIRIPAAHVANYGRDTAIVFINGRTILKAVTNARRFIIRKLNDPDLKMDELDVIGVFVGRNDDLTSQWKRLHKLWGDV